MFIAAVALSLACAAYPEFAHEDRTSATVLRLETQWSQAFLEGDAAFEKCLLTPNFTEILRDGRIEHLDYEFRVAQANRGKHRPAGPFPPETVMLYGNVAVAYGTVTLKRGPGTAMRFADYYAWDGRAWHVFFAEQTAY